MTRLRTLSCLYCRHSSQHVPDTLLSGFSTLRCPNFRHRPSCSFFIQDHVKIPNTLSYIFQALRCLSFGQYSVRFTDNNVSVEILNSIVSGLTPGKWTRRGVSYAALVSVADASASKSSGARRLHHECRRRVL